MKILILLLILISTTYVFAQDNSISDNEREAVSIREIDNSLNNDVLNVRYTTSQLLQKNINGCLKTKTTFDVIYSCTYNKKLLIKSDKAVFYDQTLEESKKASSIPKFNKLDSI